MRLRPAATVLTAVLAAGVLGGDLWVLSQRTRTGTVELQEAVERFRAAEVAVEPTSEAPSPQATPEVTPPPSPGAAPAEAGRVAPPPPVASGAPVATPSTPPSTAVQEHRPPEGVYAYRTTGGESISVADSRHRYPERTYGTVRHLDGCRWELTNEVIEEHTDRRVLCTEAGRVLQLQQSRHVTFFGKRDGMTLVCDPAIALVAPDDVPGVVSGTVCAGDGTEARAERVLVGRETMDISGVAVEVVHVKITSRVSGKAKGHAVDDLWVIPGNGLTARWRRTVDTEIDAAFGASVRYREDADFVLESLDPRT